MLGGVADCAGVEHYDVGFGFVGGLQVGVGEDGAHQLAVAHVHLTAVGLQEVG